MKIINDILRFLARLWAKNPESAASNTNNAQSRAAINPVGHLPPYIDYPNDFDMPLPGNADDTYMYCFPIQCDYNSLLQLCDQRFNYPLKGYDKKFFPLTTHAMLVVSDIGRGYSTVESYPKKGYVNEKGAQVFIFLAECTQNEKGQWVAQRIVTAVPYIAVDSVFTLVIGREQLGFPKTLAQFDFPESPATADKFGVNAYGYQQFGENEKAGYYSWLRIERTANTPPAEPGKWTSTDEAWKHIKDLFERVPKDPEFKEGLPFIIQELEDLLKAELPMIFLKQFRDADVPDDACHQTIVEGPCIIKAFHGGWFLDGSYTIHFDDFASYPIKADLGLPNTYNPSIAFWVHTDMLFGQGQTIKG